MPYLIIAGIAAVAALLYEAQGAAQQTNKLADTLVTGAVVLGGLYLAAKASRVA